MRYQDVLANRDVEVFTTATSDAGIEKQYTGVEVTNLEGDVWVAEIGCWFNNFELTDYDGVYELTPWVIEALRQAGWIVPDEFETFNKPYNA